MKKDTNKFAIKEESREEIYFSNSEVLKVEVRTWVTYNKDGSVNTRDTYYHLSVKVPFSQVCYKLIFVTSSKDKLIEYAKGLSNELNDMCKHVNNYSPFNSEEGEE